MDAGQSWTSVCRLCDKTSEKMLNIFDKNQEGLQILNLIKAALNIVIYRTDPLSKFICDVCYDNLCTVYAFKKQVSDVVENQKLQLERNGPSVKIQLYLNLLQSQNMVDENETANGVSCLNMKDMSTITDQSFLFDESQKLEDDLNYSDLNSVNSMLVDSLNLNDTMNNNDTMTESDMELCDPTETPQSKIIVTKRKRKFGNFAGPACKKRRVIGPKSRVPPRVKIITEIKYNPHSLLKCAIDVFNKQNVPDFNEKCYDIVEIIREEVINLCNYCGAVFDTANELAIHELNGHIQLYLERVDNDGYWSSSESYAEVRNHWYMTHHMELEEASTEDGEDGDAEMEDDLLIPLEDTKTIYTGRSSNIVFVNEQPTLNGIPLMSVPKDKRGDFYQSVRLNGIRRKFCNLCRYTFKDNWAIELHYMSRTCYYTCNYCGIKFNKNKYAFAKHIAEHKFSGHKRSEKVFVNKTKSGTVPKELSLSAMKPYVPIPNRYINKVRPIKMKSLLEKKKVNPTTLKIKTEVQIPVIKKEGKQKYPPPMTTADLANSENKAYFCKKCYQVFCKLNEYNEHNTICTGEKPNDPEMNVIRHYHKKEKFNTDTSPYKPVLIKKTPIKTKIENNVEVYSSTGRPVRHCVREVSYSDDKEPEFKPTIPAPVLGQFECNLCSSVFPTVHSRNSHMRIHKTGFKSAVRSPMISSNLSQLTIKHEPKSNNSPNIMIQKKIKQETFEPIVEIHEGHSSKVPSSIGSVSITPLNVNKKNNKVSPAIMQLVQNNPNITIKTKTESPSLSSFSSAVNNHINNTSPAIPDFERSYKCSSCSQHFANKSNLYFHKKNQCGGSKYPCPFCKKRFGTEATYSSHIFYSHPV